MQDTIKSDSFPLKNWNKYFHNPRPIKPLSKTRKKKSLLIKLYFKRRKEKEIETKSFTAKNNNHDSKPKRKKIN